MRPAFKTFTAVAVLGVVAVFAWYVHSVGEAGKMAATGMTGGNPDAGKAAISAYGCGACHTIPGIPGAYATVGPSLAQMGSRSYVGGVVKNTPQNLVAWIENPLAIDPKSAMPHLRVKESDARDIAAYLYTLQ